MEATPIEQIYRGKLAKLVRHLNIIAQSEYQMLECCNKVNSPEYLKVFSDNLDAYEKHLIHKLGEGKFDREDDLSKDAKELLDRHMGFYALKLGAAKCDQFAARMVERIRREIVWYQ